MELGDCLASTSFEKSNKVKKGDTFYFKYSIDAAMENLRAFYDVVAEENDWKKMHKESDFKHIEMPCKIVDFFDHNDPRGKVPLSMAEDLIIMEYKYHMKWWSENLDVDKWTENRHLMEYM